MHLTTEGAAADAAASEHASSSGGAPGKRAATQRLTTGRSAPSGDAQGGTTGGTTSPSTARLPDPFDFSFGGSGGGVVQRKADNDHDHRKPLTEITIEGVTLTASAGFAELERLETMLEKKAPARLLQLRDAVQHDLTAFAPLAGLIVEDLLPADLALLATITRRYIDLIPILSLAPEKQPAALMRKDLEGYGFGEKDEGDAEKADGVVHKTEGEIDCGGDIGMAIYSTATAIFGDIARELPAVMVNVTGANDDAHVKMRLKNEPHSQGRAVDFTVTPMSGTTLDQVAKIIGRRVPDIHGAWNADIDGYIDEYRNPSTTSVSGNKKAAGHFHVQVKR